MGLAHAYASAVLHRARTPMPPADFQPDWDDQPRPDRFFPGAERLPLPPCPPEAGATTQAGLTGPDGERPFTLPLLAGMLQDSCGLLSRRLSVHANVNVTTMPSYRSADWARGAASGGGLYPVGCYWVTGPGGPVLPGVYHYAPAHHALERLVTGDATAQLRTASAASGDGADTDQFLVLGVKYWRNAFKYGSFSYHVVSMDVGAVLQTWRVWARAHGLRIGPLHWFDETRVSELLGLDPEQEGVFAVVPLRWEPATTTTMTTTAAGPAAAPAAPAAAGPAMRVPRRDQERSRVVHRFELLEEMRRAALAGDTDRPAASALSSALPRAADQDGRRTPLEPAPSLDLPVRTALRERRSSFGRFSSHTPLEPGELAAVLDAAVAAAGADSDAAADRRAPLASLHVCVNHVRALTPASYRYDPQEGALTPVRDRAPGPFLQRAYTLDNYNVEQAGAVLVASVRTAAVLDAVGDRGYRLVGAVVGAVAQAVYTACAALGVGCGVALGFDADSYVEELALEGGDELPLLIMMIGHERPGPAGYRYEIA
ncbi:SagB family peptide dehydrogenase [Streptacidiphilus neutrinimicus]|uniref:SagB family peptide dehydrogenase n=1 Tax=Streptacidiphilus neutrinimicus TaxID=105420 RepID=UPI0005A6DB67|nr:SagB family peptide dehydrogenase [Streptacidiphilus neutrinimicus]